MAKHPSHTYQHTPTERPNPRRKHRPDRSELSEPDGVGLGGQVLLSVQHPLLPSARRTANNEPKASALGFFRAFLEEEDKSHGGRTRSNCTFLKH